MDTDFKETKANIESCNHFLVKYAQAINTWQHVETQLSELFRVLMDARDPHLSYCVFSEVRHFDLQRKIVHSVILADLHIKQQEKDTWGKLNERLRKKSHWRNALVHGKLWYSATKKEHSPEIDWDNLVWNIGPHETNWPKMQERPNNKQPITEAQIKDWTVTFDKLKQDVREFRWTLEKQLPLREKTPPPDPYRPDQ